MIKCIIVVAPHTSNWDFIIGKLAYSSIGRTANFFDKKRMVHFSINLFQKYRRDSGGTKQNNSMTGFFGGRV